jgi:hypothetical protein
MSDVARITAEVGGGTTTFTTAPRTFKTGSKGFFGVAKIYGADGRRYQVIVSVVEIGTKPASGSEPHGGGSAAQRAGAPAGARR